MRRHAYGLCFAIRGDQNNKDADILKIFEKSLNHCWTHKEHAKFVESVKKHGKDYKMIQKVVPTKTRVSI